MIACTRVRAGALARVALFAALLTAGTAALLGADEVEVRSDQGPTVYSIWLEEMAARVQK